MLETVKEHWKVVGGISLLCLGLIVSGIQHSLDPLPISIGSIGLAVEITLIWLGSEE